MVRLGLSEDAVISIVQEGKDCMEKRRKPWIREVCGRKRSKTFKVCLKDSFAKNEDDPCWYVFHVGPTKWRDK